MSPGMDIYWRLDGHTPVRCESYAEVDDAMRARFDAPGDQDPWRVDSTNVGDYWVSTVFLCIDHSFHHDGPPELFETMVFGDYADDEDEYQERCATWEEAEEMHKRGVAWAESRLKTQAVAGNGRSSC